MRNIGLMLVSLVFVFGGMGCDSDPVASRNRDGSVEHGADSPGDNAVMVSLFQEKVTLAELAQRPQAERLEWLDAGHAELTDEDMEWLPKFRGLHKLELDVNSKISDDSLQHLSQLSELRDLTLFFCPKLTGEGFIHLKDLDLLTSLDIGNNPGLTDESLKHLQALKGLQNLSANPVQGITNEGLKHLAGIPDLRILKIGSKQLTDAGLPNLYSMKQLYRLHLNPGPPENSRITSEGLEALKAALPDCQIFHSNER